MLGMLARQACRQHVVIGNDTRAEMTKNALNLCDFSILQTVVSYYWPCRNSRH